MVIQQLLLNHHDCTMSLKGIGLHLMGRTYKGQKKCDEIINLLGVDFDPYFVQTNLVCACVSAHSYQHLKNKEMAC